MSKGKEKRQSIRMPLLSEMVTVMFPSGEEYRQEITDVSENGVFIKMSAPIKPLSFITLGFNLPGDLGQLKLQAVVTRVAWTVNKKKGHNFKGIGCQLVDAVGNYKKIWDSYIIYLRNKQIITVSKRIIEEFFKGGPQA